MRSEFEQRFREFRSKIFHDSDYMRKYVPEVVRLTGNEMRARNKAAEERVARLIDSGWRPRPGQEIRTIYVGCFQRSDYREEPFSDLYNCARNAYRDIGLPDPELVQSPERLLGEVQVQAANEAILNLEMHLQPQPSENQIHAFRRRVLESVYLALERARERTVDIAHVQQQLHVPADVQSQIDVGKAVRYWIEREAIDGTVKAVLDSGVPLIIIRGLTRLGYDIMENRPTHGTQISNYGTIGNVGPMSGGVINQNIGFQTADLVTALEQIRNEVADDERIGAMAVDSAATGALAEINADRAQPGRLARMLQGLSEAVRTLGETPSAYVLVVTAAGHLGIHLPSLPGPG